MALEFGFYDSYNHDRMYSAENMNDIFEGVLTEGVYAGVGNEFHVKPSIGLQVTVDTGRAWFKSTWNKNRTLAPVNFDQPDPVYDRIDTLCIRVQKDILERRNDFFVYRGSILVNPQPPVIQNTDDTFYLPLANITVRAKSEEIKVSDIEILVGRERCPYVTSILQQTDISDLFARWENQFMDWWNEMRKTLSDLEEGEVAGLILSIGNKLDKTSDKATIGDTMSDDKWMSPSMTKRMIDDSVGDVAEELQSGVVKSFKGRKGDVNPTSGDYTAGQVGALPIGGGTLTGALTIGTASSKKNLTVNGDETLTGTLDVTGATTLNSSLGVTGATTLSGTLTANSIAQFKNTVTIQNGTSTYGGTLNFYDTNVQIKESSSNVLELKANSIKFTTTATTNPLTLNGNPIGTWKFTLLDSQEIPNLELNSNSYVSKSGNAYTFPSTYSMFFAVVKTSNGTCTALIPWNQCFDGGSGTTWSSTSIKVGTLMSADNRGVYYIDFFYKGSSSTFTPTVYGRSYGTGVSGERGNFYLYGIKIE